MTISATHCWWKPLALTVPSQVTSHLPNTKESNYAINLMIHQDHNSQNIWFLKQEHSHSSTPTTFSTLLFQSSLKTCFPSCTWYVRLVILGKATLSKSLPAARLPSSTGTEMDLEVDLWRRDAPSLIKDVALWTNGNKGLSFCFPSSVCLFSYSTAVPCTSTSFPSIPFFYLMSHFPISPCLLSCLPRELQEEHDWDSLEQQW